MHKLLMAKIGEWDDTSTSMYKNDNISGFNYSLSKSDTKIRIFRFIIFNVYPHLIQLKIRNINSYNCFDII